MRELKAILSTLVLERVPDPFVDWSVEAWDHLNSATLGQLRLQGFNWNHLRVHVTNELKKLTIDVVCTIQICINLSYGLELLTWSLPLSFVRLLLCLNTIFSFSESFTALKLQYLTEVVSLRHL